MSTITSGSGHYLFVGVIIRKRASWGSRGACGICSTMHLRALRDLQIPPTDISWSQFRSPTYFLSSVFFSNEGKNIGPCLDLCLPVILWYVVCLKGQILVLFIVLVLIAIRPHLYCHTNGTQHCTAKQNKVGNQLRQYITLLSSRSHREPQHTSIPSSVPFTYLWEESQFWTLYEEPP